MIPKMITQGSRAIAVHWAPLIVTIRQASQPPSLQATAHGNIKPASTSSNIKMDVKNKLATLANSGTIRLVTSRHEPRKRWWFDMRGKARENTRGAPESEPEMDMALNFFRIRLIYTKRGQMLPETNDIVGCILGDTGMGDGWIDNRNRDLMSDVCHGSMVFLFLFVVAVQFLLLWNGSPVDATPLMQGTRMGPRMNYCIG